MVPPVAASAGWRSRLRFLFILVLAAGGTAVVATFLAGFWDYADARDLAARAWRTSRDWINEQRQAEASGTDLLDDSPGRRSPIEWQITLRTGEAYQAEPGAEPLRLQTEFGLLTIPIDEVLSVTPDTETPVSLRRTIAVLIDQLGGPDTGIIRESAEQLAQIGPDAVAQLEQAQAERELEIARAAADVLARIRAAGLPETASPEGDFVATRYFGVRGRLAQPEIVLKTDAGEAPMAWNQLRRVDRKPFCLFAAEAATIAADPTGSVMLETDQGKHRGILLSTVLPIQTPYGKLQVPSESIVAIQRPAEESLQAAEQATIDLLRAEDAAARSAAIDRLGAAGPAAAWTLQRVAECDDERAKDEARAWLTELAKQGGMQTPLPFRITTVHGELGGVIQDQVLEIRTPQGEIETHDLASIRKLTRL